LDTPYGYHSARLLGYHRDREIAVGFATFSDLFVGRQVPCRLRGCERTWLWSKEEQVSGGSGRGKGAALEPPKRMCDPCAKRASEVADREVPCSKEGCGSTWRWTRFQQVEAWLRAREAEPKAPRGFCDACRAQVNETQDKAVPCRVRGCDQTWTWPARQQVLAGPDGKPADRMCERCETTFRGLEDQRLPCKIGRGKPNPCPGTFSYTKWAQLEALIKDKEEPARMCDACAARYGALADQTQPCRIKGCDETWSWTRGAQLEAAVGSPGPMEPPERMCGGCYGKWSQLSDRELPCKRHGCSGTWTWKRGEQLSGKPAPARLCAACVEAMSTLHDQEAPCEHQADGCPGTWTYSRIAQLSAGHRKTAPHHPCPDCQAFLREARTREIPCQKCSAVITWPPHSQLMTRLGKWIEPTLCGQCKRTAETDRRRIHPDKGAT
jgi:hypothetical protein